MHQKVTTNEVYFSEMIILFYIGIPKLFPQALFIGYEVKTQQKKVTLTTFFTLMEILNRETDTEGTFFIEIEGEIMAEMMYAKVGSDRIIIQHTEVSSVLRGKQAGEQMVKKAVEYARSKRISIVPTCNYAKSVFTKHPEWKDVL